MADETGPEAFIRQQTAIMNRADSRDSLSSIRCPTLVLAAGADALISPEHSVELAQGIAGAKLVTIPNCGHLSTLEKSDQISTEMLAFLQT